MALKYENMLSDTTFVAKETLSEKAVDICYVISAIKTALLKSIALCKL